VFHYPLSKTILIGTHVLIINDNGIQNRTLHSQGNGKQPMLPKYQSTFFNFGVKELALFVPK
jgi:hypothetical protein